MAYAANQEPTGLTALTSLDAGDLIIVGDVSDASEAAKKITKANLLLDLHAAPTFTTSITTDYLTASEIVLTNASKQLVSAPVATYPSLTELTYVKGVTSAIQTQLGAKAPTASPTFTGTVSAADVSLSNDLLMASGGIINFDSGDVTITHGANDLQFAGAAEYGFTGGDLLVYGAGVVGGNFIGTYDTNGSHQLRLAAGSDLTANRTLTFTTGDADRTLTIEASATINQDTTTDATPQFTGIEVGHASDTTISRVSAGKIAVEGVNVVTTASTDTLTGTKTLGTTADIKLGSAVTDKCGIQLNDSALNDESWSGTIIAATAGATLAVGDVCYLASSGKWVLVDGILDGTDTGFNKKLGICVLASTDTNPTEILLDGVIASAAFPAFTVGSPVYLDDTAGDLVVAQPSTTNFAIRIVGYAVSATVLHFQPSQDYIVHV